MRLSMQASVIETMGQGQALSQRKPCPNKYLSSTYKSI